MISSLLCQLFLQTAHPQSPPPSSASCLFYSSCQNQVFQATFFGVRVPNNLICLALNSHISFLSTSALSKTSSLLTLSVQGILVILRKNHTSQLSNRFRKTDVNVNNVHASLPYINKRYNVQQSSIHAS